METRATWKNGKRTVTGKWRYNWSADSFTVTLDTIDRITGQNKVIVTTNDTPEWGNWKRITEPGQEATQ